MKTKEIAKVEAEIKSELGNIERDMVIRNDEDLERAVAVHQGIKKLAKSLKERKEALTKPLNEALKAWRGVFKPYEEQLEKAEEAVAGKVLAYKSKKDAQAEAKRDKIAGQVAAGTMDAEKGVAKMEGIQGVEISGGSHVRTYKALEIYDESVIPREFLVPDRVKITEALKAGVVVQGAKLVDKQTLV